MKCIYASNGSEISAQAVLIVQWKISEKCKYC